MPKKREQRHDDHGPLTKMAEADGWVMVRRPYCAPFALTVKEWNELGGEAAEGEQGYIYFIDGGEHIKIGYSRSLDHRMRKMDTDLPDGARVLHVQPGTFRTEKVLHRHFKDCRHRGEWFHKTPELLDYIEQRKSMAP